MAWSGAITKQHTFQVAAEGIAIRSGPHEQADRTGDILRRGEIFIAEHVIEGIGKDRRTYLKLPEGRGWVFDDGKIYPEDPSVRPYNPKSCEIVEAKPLLGVAMMAMEDCGIVPVSTPPHPLPPKSPISSPGVIRAATTPTRKVSSPAQVLISDVASPQRAALVPKVGTPQRASSVPGPLPLAAVAGGVQVATLSASPGTPVRGSPPAGSPSSRARAGAAATAGPWSMLRSYRLCEVGEEHCYSTGVFLDQAAIASVSAAVEDLNKGTLKCDAVACAVLSAKRKEWYVLYQADQKEASQRLFARAPPKQTATAAAGAATTTGTSPRRQVAGGTSPRGQVAGGTSPRGEAPANPPEPEPCPSPSAPPSFAAKWQQRPSVGSWLLLPVAPLRGCGAKASDDVSTKLTAVPVGSSISTKASTPAAPAPQRSRTPAKPQPTTPGAPPLSARGTNATSPRGTATVPRSTSSQLQATSGGKPCNSGAPGGKASSAELEERFVAEKKKELKLLAEKNARRVARMKVEGKEEKEPKAAADENVLRNAGAVVPPLALRRNDASRASQPLSARRSPDEAPPLPSKIESGTTSPTDMPGSPPTMPGTPLMSHCLSEKVTSASTGSSAVPLRQVSYPGPRFAPGIRAAVASPQSPIAGARPRGGWNAANSFVLCKEGEEAAFAGKGTFLDRAVIASVNAAVQELNRGTVRLQGETCAVFSASRREWYVLHSPGRREAAMKEFGVAVAAPAARAALASTPQQATRLVRNQHPVAAHAHAAPAQPQQQPQQQASRPGTPARPVPLRSPSTGSTAQAGFAVKQPVVKRLGVALAAAPAAASAVPTASPPRGASLKLGSPSTMHRALVPGGVLPAAHVVPVRSSPRQKSSNAGASGGLQAAPPPPQQQHQLSHPQAAGRG